MNIILHADDFGYDKDTTEATIELLQGGYLSSASIMANMPCTKEACQYASAHPEKSFGVHLTYVDELSPCCNPDEIVSLVNTSGRFLMADETLKRALSFRLRVNDIVKESCAQIDKLKNAGVKISHLDSHGHLHKYPSFQMALSTICKKTGINKVRRSQNVFIEKQIFGPRKILRSCLNLGIVMRFKSTDYFFMSANGFHTGWSEALCSQLNALPANSTIEIGVHPGIHSCGEESYRVNEYNDIIEFVKLIKHSNHKIINWNNI